GESGFDLHDRIRLTCCRRFVNSAKFQHSGYVSEVFFASLLPFRTLIEIVIAFRKSNTFTAQVNGDHIALGKIRESLNREKCIPAIELLLCEIYLNISLSGNSIDLLDVIIYCLHAHALGKK